MRRASVTLLRSTKQHTINAKVAKTIFRTFLRLILPALFVFHLVYVFETPSPLNYNHRQENATFPIRGANTRLYIKAAQDAWKPSEPVCVLKKTNVAPVPVILMSRGRSGSSSTWQVLSNLTGYETKALEYPGKDTKKTTEFFNRFLEDKSTRWRNGNWILAAMCILQRNHPKAAMVGFKLKPYFNPSFYDEFIDSLKFLAYNQKIKVVRLRRSVLDVAISRHKHKLFQTEAHCKKGEIDCIQGHLENKLTLPTENLLEELRASTKEEDEVDRLLEEIGVPHVKVSYDKLYYGSDAEEWMRIFNLLGKGPVEGLTHEQVMNAQEHVATHNRSHEATLQNFEEVKNIFGEN